MPFAEPKRPAGPSAGVLITFWSTLPGILTGIAASVTAVVGLIALLTGLGGPGGDHQTLDQASGPSSQAGAAQTPQGAHPSIAASVSPRDVLIGGRLTMESVDEADLETGVVRPGVAGGDLYLFCSGGSCGISAPGNGLITDAKQQVGTRSGCIEALTTRHDLTVDLGHLRVGQRICVQTNDGHISALTIVGLPQVGATQLTFSYTLWG
jgi:hypothetical protein